MAREICQHLFANFRVLFSILIVEHTVAIAFEIGIRDLLPELLADALVFLGALKPAGAIAAGTLCCPPRK